jgi:hypothetical protein
MLGYEVGKEVGGMKSRHAQAGRRTIIGAAVSVFAMLTLASCTPETGPQSIQDYDVVVTLYDKSADFGSIRTYLMPDSVVHFQNSDHPADGISHDYDDLILERVEYNLQAIGYTKETDPEHNAPDVYVLVSAASSQWRAVDYSWLPRWGWWAYWPDAASDWMFMSPYYAGGSVFTFSTGTLLIDMADYRDADPENGTMPGAWTAAMNGLLAADTPQRLVDFIDRAFHQSLYLGAGD